MTQILILGAGVAGLCTAIELLKNGSTVHIYDPKGLPNSHSCSWWAGGMLAPYCETESAEEPVLRLGCQAIDWWAEYTQVTRAGTLVVAKRRDLPDLKRFAAHTQEHLNFSAEQILALESDLTQLSAGLFFSKEAHLHPRQALQDLTDWILKKGGVFLPETPETFDITIDCRGIAAKPQLPDLRGVKGEMLILRCPDLNLSRPIRLLHPRIPLYIVPRGDGVYMLGATMIESEDRNRFSARSMLELLSAAYALNPAFAEAEILEMGVDLRPAFPDNLPRIRRRGNIIYANGLYRHGFLLAPALAKGVSDLILHNHISELVDENFS